MTHSTITWESGHWTHEPVDSHPVDAGLVNAGPVDAGLVDAGLQVTAAEGSDAWRHTSYGFVHASEHALIAPLPVGRAVEVTFTADLAEQFDQAGAFLRIDDENWVKAGVEFSDGLPQLGAVVTLGQSDWSASPVPGWSGRRVTIRVSRASESITVRARVDDEPWQLVRVAPVPEGVAAEAGPFLCAPTRADLAITFHSWVETDADASLH